MCGNVKANGIYASAQQNLCKELAQAYEIFAGHSWWVSRTRPTLRHKNAKINRQMDCVGLRRWEEDL
jgi:hypothetical protein